MSFNDLERGLAIITPTTTETVNNDPFKSKLQTTSKKLFRLTEYINRIRQHVGVIGTLNDSQELRKSLHDQNESATSLIKEINQDFKSLNELLPDNDSNRGRKLEQQKLFKDFQRILQQFQNLQKTSAEKNRQSLYNAKNLIKQEIKQMHDMDESIENQPLLTEPERQVQLEILDNEIEFNESLIREREEEIRDIERGITEINEIFRDLGTLVNEQQSLLDNIEANISTTATNVRNASDQLTKANRYQKKARNRMCFLLLFLVIIVAIFVLIMVP